MADPIPVQFGEWAPDQPDLANSATVAKGVMSIAGAYGPFPAYASVGGTDIQADAQILGGKSVYDASTDPVVFAGDTSKLYKVESRALTDVKKSGGYTIGTEDWWMFEQFGNYVVAVANGTTPQVYQIGVSSAFADLAGTPPDDATCVARIGDFLMMGKASTVYWSAFNDITDWIPDPVTQAGSQVLNQEHGRIQTIVGGDYASIFHERAIRRAVYVGGSVIWDFGQDAVETRRGAIGPYATARFGRLTFFAADDGFYVFDGQNSSPIGYGKVDEYFTKNLNYADRHRVCMAVDSVRKVLAVGFPYGASTKINTVLLYSTQDQRWTYCEDSLDFLYDGSIDPLTVDSFHNWETSDDLDTTNLDPYTIDSDAFDDRRRLLLGWTSADHEFVSYTGANRAALLESLELEPSPGRRGKVLEIWPIGEFADRSTVSAAVGYQRALPDTSMSYTNATTMNIKGFCPQRIDARFMRGRLQVGAGADWRRITGFHVKSRVTGGR